MYLYADGSVRFVSERVRHEIFKYSNYVRDDRNVSVQQ
jgi:hypothetical protein